MPSNPLPRSASGVCATTLVPKGCIENSMRSGGLISQSELGVLLSRVFIGVFSNRYVAWSAAIAHNLFPS